MTVDQLFADAVAHIVKAERALLGFHLTVQRHLKQHIAKLLAQQVCIVLVDGIHRFIGLLDEVHPDGCMGLLPIPGAALRRTQLRNDADQILCIVPLFGCKAHGNRPLTL